MMTNMLPCFPSFQELFTASYDTPSAGRDHLLIVGGSDDESSDTNHSANENPQDSRHRNSRRRKKSAAMVILKLDTFSGALQLPQYQQVSRDSCPLLRHCWNHHWGKVVDICTLEPHRALHKTKHSGRTALHLAIFNRQCPLDVAQALLAANRHMVLVQDANRYTPLHMLAFFQPKRPAHAEGDDGAGQDLQDEQQTNLVELVCDTAIMVEQELRNDALIPPAYGTSPLFLAAKRNAPLSILKTLLNTRKRTRWIAPSTGGEPYWDCQTLDEYSSPLEVLLRDSNRASKYMNPDNLRSNRRLREKLRQMAYRRLSRRRGGAKVDDSFCNSTTGGDETNAINNVFGIDHHNTAFYKEDCDLPQRLAEHSNLEKATLNLWEKCIELLVGYCPLLEVGDNASHIPYGVLHAVTCCKVPIPSLVQVAMILFPEQALQRDEQGFIPLHHVLRSNHKYAISTLLNILLPSDGVTNTDPLLETSALMRFPNDGPTPLAYALLNRLPVDPVIDKLLVADSDVSLHTADPSTCLYPFCLAALRDGVSERTYGIVEKEIQEEIDGEHASGSRRTEEESTLNKLSVSYRLLRAHPQVLAQMVPCYGQQAGGHCFSTSSLNLFPN